MSLKSSIIVLSVLDIFFGFLYCLVLAGDVFAEWRFFNMNGPHYILLGYYIIRTFSFVFGILGLISTKKMDSSHAKLYYRIKIYELIVLPILSLASINDMCQSYVFNRSC
jgi:hypothetical protein